MYGSILEVTRNQGLALQILTEVFLLVYDQDILLTTAPENWRIRLITFSLYIANQELDRLKSDSIDFQVNSIAENSHPLLQLAE